MLMLLVIQELLLGTTTATENDVLLNKIFYDDRGVKLTGNILTVTSSLIKR